MNSPVGVFGPARLLAGSTAARFGTVVVAGSAGALPRASKRGV